MTRPDRPLFALVREDPNVELSLIARSAARRIVVVGSGGCTALSLLSDDVEHVCVIDASPAQMALVSLRVAAIEAFDRPDYLRFIGALPHPARLADWEILRSRLSRDVRAYWDALPEAIAAGIDGCGTTEAFYRFVGQSLRASDWPESVWNALLDESSMSAQRFLVAAHIGGDRFRIALEMLLSRFAHGLFYPPSIFAHAVEIDCAAQFARRFLDFAARMPLAGNYFLSQLIFGTYRLERDDGVPPYLTETGYRVVRRNLPKLRRVTGALQDALDPSMQADAFFLSNVLDWTDPALADRIGARVHAAARPGASVLVRHMLGRAGLPSTMRARRDPEAEAAALRTERSFLYGALSIGWL